MSITAAWLDDSKSAIIFVFEGGWTWGDYHHVVDESVPMFQEGGPVVSVIVDFSGSTMTPSGTPFAQAHRAFQVFASQPNYSHIIVAITHKSFTAMLAKMMVSTGIAPDLKVVTSRAEALALIRAKQSNTSRD